MSWLPKLPTGTHGAIQKVAQLIRVCRSLRIKESPDIRVERSADGVTLRLKDRPKKSSGGGGDRPVWL